MEETKREKIIAGEIVVVTRTEGLDEALEKLSQMEQMLIRINELLGSAQFYVKDYSIEDLRK